MTDTEKAIQEMAKVLCDSIDGIKESRECKSCGGDMGWCVFREHAKELYEAGFRKAVDVRKNTVKELQQLTIEYFCEMAEEYHIQLTQFDIPKLRDNFDKYFKRYGFSVYDIVRDDNKLRDEIYTEAANDILKNIGEMYTYDYMGKNVQVKTLSWFKWLCETEGVKVEE